MDKESFIKILKQFDWEEDGFRHEDIRIFRKGILVFFCGQQLVTNAWYHMQVYEYADLDIDERKLEKGIMCNLYCHDTFISRIGKR